MMQFVVFYGEYFIPDNIQQIEQQIYNESNYYDEYLLNFRSSSELIKWAKGLPQNAPVGIEILPTGFTDFMLQMEDETGMERLYYVREGKIRRAENIELYTKYMEEN